MCTTDACARPTRQEKYEQGNDNPTPRSDTSHVSCPVPFLPKHRTTLMTRCVGKKVCVGYVRSPESRSFSRRTAASAISCTGVWTVVSGGVVKPDHG